MCVLLFNSRAVWRARTEFVSRFVFSFQIRTQSCSVRVYFVSLSYAFVFSSYPSCVLFMWGLKTSCQFRIQSCGFRVCFVFFSRGFVFSSFCACVSFLFACVQTSPISFVARVQQRKLETSARRQHFCWFWKNRVEFVSSRAVVVIIPYTFQAVSCSVRNRLCFFFMWGVKNWCRIRIQLCGVRVSFVSF